MMKLQAMLCSAAVLCGSVAWGNSIEVVGDPIATTNGPYRIFTVTNSVTAGSVTFAEDATVDLLVVGGGGGGGASYGGGGGAGGFVWKKNLAVSAGAYAVTVGAGGAQTTVGKDSAFGDIVAYGGGAGGRQSVKQNQYTAETFDPTGGVGGSGGGAGGGYWTGKSGGSAKEDAVGGVQGCAGGASYGNSTGGGGGAGAPGASGGLQCLGNSYAFKAGDGGAGLPCDITGVEVWYAGGGGGAGGYTESTTIRPTGSLNPGCGGKGGGGKGAVKGTDGLGGGGGGAAVGGRGTVILRLLDPELETEQAVGSIGEIGMTEIGRAKASVTLSYLGSAGQPVAVTLKRGAESGAYTESIALSNNWSEASSATFAFAVPTDGSKIFVRLEMTGDFGAAWLGEEASFDTWRELSANDTVEARIFPGTQGTADGNPRASDGQGWYRGNLTTPLMWYAAGTGEAYDRWATGAQNAGGSGTAYARIWDTTGNGDFEAYDKWYAFPRIGWVYEARQMGDYRIEIDKFTKTSYARWSILYKSSANEPWVESGVSGGVATDIAFTQRLGKGGCLALKMNSGSSSAAASASYAFSGLRVRYLGVDGGKSVVTVTASNTVLEENPALDAEPNKVIAFTLDRAATADVSIPLVVSGTAANGADYAFDASDVVIPAGERCVVRQLTAIDNGAIDDGGKTVTITMGEVTGAVRGDPCSVTLATVDDDTPMRKKGDVVRATVFYGPTDGSDEGNPSPSGQGWYRADNNAKFAYDASGPKWINRNSVYASGGDCLFLKDVGNTRKALYWLETVSAPGDYVISCNSISFVEGSTSHVYHREKATDDWTLLNERVSTFALTNHCRRGGGFKVLFDCSAMYTMSGTWQVSGLKVTCLGPQGFVIIVR